MHLYSYHSFSTKEFQGGWRALAFTCFRGGGTRARLRSRLLNADCCCGAASALLVPPPHSERRR